MKNLQIDLNKGLVHKSLYSTLLPAVLLPAILIFSGCQSTNDSQSGASTSANKITHSISHLPEAPTGYKWQLIDNMSDEFNGSTLDVSKWNDSISSWKGRPPARFLKENVKVTNGHLTLKSSTYTGDNEGFTMGGAAVSGKHRTTYGYFEARVKASKTKMSTTFWLHSDERDNSGTGCNTSHSTEIDILEAIGGWPHRSWTDVMHSNTHYKGYKLTDGKCKRVDTLSKGVKYDSKTNLSDDFHVFAAWWQTPNKVNYYFDHKLVGTVEIDNNADPTPFNSEMSLRMVSETYSWQKKYIKKIKGDDQPYPSKAELDNANINTVLYDYVRSYQLVAID